MLMTARTSKLRTLTQAIVPATISIGGGASGTGGPFVANVFNGVGIGAAAADRYIVSVVAFDTGAGAVALSNVNINNSNICSKLAAFNQSTFSIEIWITNAPFTTGTIADFVPTPATGDFTDMVLATYSVRGLVSNLISGSAQSSTTSGAAMSLPILADGVAIGGSYLLDAGKPGTNDGSGFTWSGLTEGRDKKALNIHGGAAAIASSTATTLSIACTKGGGTTFGELCCALR
jgi:hypothetical protein